MRNIARNLLLASILTLAACTSPRTNVTGSWSRPSEEPSLSLTGIENITFNADSTFAILNEMTFCHSDSLFQCNAPVEISLSGRWTHEHNGDIVMTYDIDNIAVCSTLNKFQLTALSDSTQIPDSIVAMTQSDLISGIHDYYETGLQRINQIGGMKLQSPQIINSQLYSTINHQTVVWNESTIQE